MDDIPLTHYTINGIRDTPQNKCMLYGSFSPIWESLRKNSSFIKKSVIQPQILKPQQDMFHRIIFKNPKPVKNQGKLSVNLSM